MVAEALEVDGVHLVPAAHVVHVARVSSTWSSEVPAWPSTIRRLSIVARTCTTKSVWTRRAGRVVHRHEARRAHEAAVGDRQPIRQEVVGIPGGLRQAAELLDEEEGAEAAGGSLSSTDRRGALQERFDDLGQLHRLVLLHVVARVQRHDLDRR